MYSLMEAIWILSDTHTKPLVRSNWGSLTAWILNNGNMAGKSDQLELISLLFQYSFVYLMH